MMMGIASVLLRLALAAGFLSAVASRLNLIYRNTSGWTGFLDYTARVNSFLPKNLIPVVAVTATVLETGLAILLLFGYHTRFAAFGAGGLTLLFAMQWPFRTASKSHWITRYLLSVQRHFYWPRYLFTNGALTSC